jgi:hypothetical protein
VNRHNQNQPIINVSMNSKSRCFHVKEII